MWWPVVWYHSCSIGQSTYYLCGQRFVIAGHRTAFHRCRKQFHFGGPNVIYTAIAVICAACMNINKVSRVKILGGPCPLGSHAYAFVMLLIFLAFPFPSPPLHVLCRPHSSYYRRFVRACFSTDPLPEVVSQTLLTTDRMCLLWQLQLVQLQLLIKFVSYSSYQTFCGCHAPEVMSLNEHACH